MPKVKLGREPAEAQKDAARKAIRKRMVDLEIGSQAELARRMDMGEAVLSRKMKHFNWTWTELTALCRVLRFRAEDAALLLGVKV